jgi:hypothetical protein
MWDIRRNATDLIHTFLTAYYGAAAAPHVLDYMHIMTDSVKSVGGCEATDGDGGEGYPATAAFLTPEAVVKGAIALASASDSVQQRVRLNS